MVPRILTGGGLTLCACELCGLIKYGLGKPEGDASFFLGEILGKRFQGKRADGGKFGIANYVRFGGPVYSSLPRAPSSGSSHGVLFKTAFPIRMPL